jgi:hypothetical protein
MATPILLMTGLIMVGTEGPILTIGYNRHLLWAHTQIDQKTPGRFGPLFSKHKIVVMRPSFVTMP